MWRSETVLVSCAQVQVLFLLFGAFFEWLTCYDGIYWLMAMGIVLLLISAGMSAAMPVAA
jgi:hypothetical protein